MVRIFSRIILTLCCTILLAAASQAKTLKKVYLRDGGIIECQKVWKANGKVMVLVNRDTLVDLPSSEVNLKRTFARKPATTVKKEPAMKEAPSRLAAAKPDTSLQTPAQPVVAPATTHKPESLPKSGEKSVPPEVEQAVPSAEPAPPATEAPPVRTNLPVATPPVLPGQAPSAFSPGMGIANGIVMLLLAILMIVSFCKVYAKAGEAWWKAIIPIYNLFILVIISGKPWWWALLILIPIVNIPIYFIIHIALARRFGQGVVFGLGLALVGFVFFPLLAFGNYEYS